MRHRLSIIFFLCLSVMFAFAGNDLRKAWGKIDYHGQAWVRNASRPFDIDHGLDGRHLSLWASHGMYYDEEKAIWKWQRPKLFCTTEDLYTQTIVVPYLMPMLENAGAYVFTPRERDWQKNEVIVTSAEAVTVGEWQRGGSGGVTVHSGHYIDGENPFAKGNILITKATKRKHNSSANYQPRIPEGGRYAVYVSYQTVERSVPDAQYIVHHKGERTEFRINQQMGGGTWVYLGTFDFDGGCNEFNRVEVVNNSRKKGFVTTDAVRFGGGMGNIERGGSVSGMPRCLEGARYYAQWAGAPYSIYSTRGGTNDYADDINVRSLMTNWISGGSVFNPTKEGLGVPIELSLAIHSDAGYDSIGDSIVGSLAICTTDFNDGRLGAGISRMASKDFAGGLLNDVTNDLSRIYGKWSKRYLWDRNYSETRLPDVPSAILETLSHQSFPDMMYGQDPNFRFNMARAIYKSILKFVNRHHGKGYVVQPLPPTNFNVEFISSDKVKLSWLAQRDPLEKSATPSAYCLYTSTGSGAFDNGIIIKSTSVTLKLEEGVKYNFRITAINDGGESFPSETLTAYQNGEDAKRILIVNAFTRLSAPAIIKGENIQGFDLNQDFGVSQGLTAGLCGNQLCYNRGTIGIVSPDGLGYSGTELEGQFVMGNTFDYPSVHADAILKAGNYQISSSSVDAVIRGDVNIQEYDCVDFIFGLQKNDGHSLKYYKTFSPQLQKVITNYAHHGGALLISGSYIGSDMTASDEQAFLNNVLKSSYAPSDTIYTPSTVNGLGLTFNIYSRPNHLHYFAANPNALVPSENAICAMIYEDNRGAATAYKGNDYSSFVMSFPFECIEQENIRSEIMRGILNYLIK